MMLICFTYLSVHSNERPFPCHYCTQTFKSSSNRSKHERRIHAAERKASKQAALENEKLNITTTEQATTPGPQSTLKESIKKESSNNNNNASIPVVKMEPMIASDGNDSSDRVFGCEYDGCTSSFRTRSSLKDHQKVHSDER